MKDKLERKTPRILLLNSKQLNSIYKNSSEHLRLFFQLAVNTGLRLCELRSLKFSDFDLKNGIVNVCLVNSKTKKHERTVPLNYAARAALKMLKIGKNENSFLSDLSDQAFKIHCYRLSRKLGFRFSFHSLRHTFITAFYNASRDPYLTAAVSGHSSIQTTMIYVHSVGKDAARAVNSLNFDFNSEEQNLYLKINRKTKTA